MLVSELENGMKVKDQFLINSVTKNNTNNGLTYLNVELKDKSGTVYAKKWDYKDEDDDVIVPGNIVLIEGETNIYRNNLQIKITASYPLKEDEIDFTKFNKDSPVSLEELETKLNYFIGLIKDKTLSKVVTDVLSEYNDKYLSAPAGRNIHHDYPHGLLTHTISMCEIAEFFTHHYDDVDADLLISATLLHDIGKTIELDGSLVYNYTLEGKLIGHISIGQRIVHEACVKEGLDEVRRILLEHMILSHHGELEFGSPVTPLTKEALLLSQIDLIDSKVAALTKALEVTPDGDFTQKIFALDNRTFYKPKKKE
ncbi:MAG: HD domain-containing protein [Coprobacillus sp.]|nr:HD domain-containing protein [Coprobacillus sp.]